MNNVSGFMTCHKCHGIIGTHNGEKAPSRKYHCRECRHNYCKDCYLAFHFHNPYTSLGWSAYGGGAIRI